MQKTVQVVIEMSEEKYKWICENNPKADKDSIIGTIVNGTVLEPHGRLIDADMLTLMDVHLIDGVFLCDAPTILEATEVSE